MSEELQKVGLMGGIWVETRTVRSMDGDRIGGGKGGGCQLIAFFPWP